MLRIGEFGFNLFLSGIDQLKVYSTVSRSFNYAPFRKRSRLSCSMGY